MNRIILLMFLAIACCFGQSKQNQLQTGLVDARGASWRFPESTFAGLPTPATGNTGWRYTVTDCATTACTAGGGSTKVDLRSDGVSAWVVIGGGGTPTQPSVFSGGGSATVQRLTECATGTVTLTGGNWVNSPGGQSVAAAAAASQELPIITGLNGYIRYASVIVGESTLFTSGTVTAVKASIGRPGATTNDELVPQTSMMQSGGNVWFAMDRPQPPSITSGGYSLVLAFRTTGGNVSDLTTAAAYYEVCGYGIQ